MRRRLAALATIPAIALSAVAFPTGAVAAAASICHPYGPIKAVLPRND